MVSFNNQPVNEVLPHGKDGLNSVRVSSQFRLEGLVLLVLRLNVRRILKNRKKKIMNKLFLRIAFTLKGWRKKGEEVEGRGTEET